MDDERLLAAIEHDDSYQVIRVLADKPSGKTELVKGEGPELLVRKRIPDELANKRAWYRLQELKLPLLPQVRDIYQLPGEFVTVTTYVDGVELSELVASLGALPSHEAAGYVVDLCTAAALLHENGIVHRDITPGNVVVLQGHARLIDLGNARAYSEGAGHDTTRMGTWGFAAPEQYGFAQTDARSDIYSLGSVLGYLLTGIRPGEDGFDEALAGERIPEDLRNVVMTARAFEPSARFQSAPEMAAALRACGEPMSKGSSAFGRKAARLTQSTAPEGRLAMRIIRWLMPAPLASRRTWSELHFVEKGLLALFWIGVIYMLFPLSMGFYHSGDGGDWATSTTSHVIAVIWTVTLVLLAREVHLLVTYVGPGRSTLEAIKTFCMRVFVILVVCFGLSVVLGGAILSVGRTP